MLGPGDIIILVDLALVVSRSSGSVIASALLVGDSAWNINDLSSDTVSLQILLDMKMALGPLSSWGIWTNEEH